MDRRAFVSRPAFGLLAAPPAAEAQQAGKVARIGYLLQSPVTEKPSAERQAFLQGLRELGYAAGHNVIIEYALCHVQRDGDGAAQDRRQALGVTAAGRVGTGQLLLKPGDRLVLYTDGVTDAIDESGRFFSEESLRETLRGARGLGSKDVIERVLEQVHRFSGGAPRADDITLLVLGYVGPRDGVET
jgi:hypothetical protein